MADGFDAGKLMPSVRRVRKVVVACAETRAEAIAITTTVLAGLMTDGLQTVHREEFLEKTTALLRQIWAKFDAERAVM